MAVAPFHICAKRLARQTSAARFVRGCRRARSTAAISFRIVGIAGSGTVTRVTTPSSSEAGLRLDSAAGRGVLAAAVLGSGMAMLDGTVVNVALRTLGKELDASLPQLQWITNGYLLALASLILLGGSLGDRFGRRRVFLIGVVWFALASLLCGIAQTPASLIAARLVQGVGAALLTPGSLAMIQAAFAPSDRAKAIGSWSGLGGIAAALGPFVGGWLIQYASWRWVFLLNLPIAALTVFIAHRCVPETRDPSRSRASTSPAQFWAHLAWPV